MGRSTVGGHGFHRYVAGIVSVVLGLALVGSRIEPSRLDPVGLGCLSSLVDEDGDHPFDMAACAAASRATGTRNGEQLT